MKQKKVGAIFRRENSFLKIHNIEPQFTMRFSPHLAGKQGVARNKKGRNHYDLMPSRLVVRTGIEPVLPE